MRAVRILLLLLLSAAALFPLYWQLVGSFMSQQVILKTPPSLLPIPAELDNYRTIFAGYPIARWLWNSVVACAGVVMLQTAIAVPAAYALEIKRFRGSNVVWACFIGSMMFSGQLSLIPMYRMLRVLGMTTNRLGLILPSAFSVFSVFVLRSYLRDFPRDILDAADIDGAGELWKLLRIVVPLSAPPILALATMAAVGVWNNFFWQSLIANTPQNRTLVVGVARTIYDAMIYHTQGQDWTDYGVLMAGAMVVFAPMGLLFCFGHRYVMKGLYARGGV